MKRRYYTFTNNQGNKVELRGDLTIEDLIRMGWTDFGLVNPETPLPDHVYRQTNEPKPETKPE
jgi:hypothetical protein